MDNVTLVNFELCEATSGATVEGDVLKNVPLLGSHSLNGNEYSAEAMQGVVTLYEGIGIYCDHLDASATGKKRRPRRIDERFGHAENVRYVEKDHDGKRRVRGDVPFLPSHPRAVSIVESYQKKRPYFGISHHADGEGVTRPDGKRLISKVVKVHSLDVVDKAATGSLTEQDGAPQSDAQVAMADAMSAMIAAIMNDATLDKAAKMKKIEALMEAHGEPGEKAPPMAGVSEQYVKQLIEQAQAAQKTQFNDLVEAAVQAKAKTYQYVKPHTKPEPQAGATAEKKFPDDPKAAVAVLRSPR